MTLSKNQRLTFWLVALTLAAAPMALAQSGGTQKDKQEAPKPASADDNFVIGADDVINISVWKEPELTRTVPVRPDGMISLPLVNDVKAAGLTPMQLSVSITEKLRKFMADPQVTVIVQTINSRKIHLVGEVNRAGTFPMLPDMTVLHALSGAGGFTQYANTKKIYVLRLENGKQSKFPFNYKEVIQGKNQEQNIVLKPGDTIVVP